MNGAVSYWQFWAVLSAVFAAVTAIFAKVGVDNINPDFATFVRTIIILLCLAAILTATGQFQSPGSVPARTCTIPGFLRSRNRRVVGVLFPRAQARGCIRKSPRLTSLALCWWRSLRFFFWASDHQERIGLAFC